jgi:Carboxypeptidase regulatory-like domain
METAMRQMLQPIFAVLAAFLLVSAVPAQQPTAQITGIITDSSGAVVPAAQIKVVNTETGMHWEAQSNESGNYAFSNLRPGNYEITVSRDGFATVNRGGINLVISQVARLDFSLKVGGTGQSVEVTATAPLLESSTASVGQVIDTRAVSDLPLNGRNYLQLAKLSSGVLEAKPGDRNIAGGSFIANGVRAQLNNFLLDGVDNNSKVVDQQNSSPVVVQPSVDAIQEFKVETNNYSAEYGYSAGAVVNATIKGGTNRLHGDVFEFVRNDVFDARNYFSNPAAAKPELRRNQFGGTLGGPIVKNRAFLFGSWEQTRERDGITYVQTIPTARMIAGDFTGQPAIFDPNTTQNLGGGVYKRTAFPNNQIPRSSMDPAAVKLLALFPAPTNSAAFNNYVVSPVEALQTNRFDFRHDLQISQNDNLFARYSYFTNDYTYPGPFAPPLVGSTTFQNSVKSTVGNGAALGETHVFSARMVNEFRAGYNRIFDVLQPFVKDYIDSQYGLGGIPAQPGVAGLPSISISGFSTIGEATFLPNSKVSETLPLEDHITLLLGNHNLKFGGSYRFVRSWYAISSSARGTYTFNGGFSQDPQNRSKTGSGMADFALGIPSSSGISNFLAGDIRYHYWGGFLQDDWKVTPRLTVNAGLRYEVWTQPVERTDRQANFYLADLKLAFANNNVPTGVPAGYVENVPAGVGSRSLMKTSYTNFAPRLGFAFQAAPSLVLRGGAGVFYADDPFIGASGRLPANPPYAISNSYPTDNISPILYLSSGFPAGAVTDLNFNTVNMNVFSPDLQNGTVYHWSIGLQKQMGQYVFEGNYVGTRGTGLPLGYNINQAYSGPGSVASRRPYPGFNNITVQEPMGVSSYNALELRAERRYSSGFSLLASYTYSKSLDNGGEQLIGDLNLRNVQNVDWEYSLSAGDMRNRFVTSAIYDLPFGHGRHFAIANPVLDAIAGGWQVNTILTLHSGQPFTPSLGVSSANTGAARPNRIGDGNLPGSQRTIQNWFDKTAFVSPPQYQYGNAGRNILFAPGAANMDFSLFKRFPLARLREGSELQFRAESFNFLNHPQFGMPNSRVDIAQGGSITSLSTPMRQMQLGLKFLF